MGHIRNIHGDQQGPFPCELCGKLYKNKKSLGVHMYDMHKNKCIQQQ
jgi:hypothetical protein